MLCFCGLKKKKSSWDTSCAKKLHPPNSWVPGIVYFNLKTHVKPVLTHASYEAAALLLSLWLLTTDHVTFHHGPRLTKQHKDKHTTHTATKITHSAQPCTAHTHTHTQATPSSLIGWRCCQEPLRKREGGKKWPENQNRVRISLPQQQLCRSDDTSAFKPSTTKGV